MVEQTGSLTLIDGLVIFSTHWLMPFMFLIFIGAVAMRLMIYYTVMREFWFAKEFEKRVDAFSESLTGKESLSFYATTKKLLEKTFYELFEVRYYMKRRRPDFVMTWSDRVFLIKQGAARLVHDILKNVKPVKHQAGVDPKLFQTSKKVLAHNPCFSKVFGVLPTATFTDLINMLPGTFIVLGVFGTFLGIMKALPELGGMNLSDVEGTKMVMDQFLLKISFAMSSSLIGIIFSILISVVNSTFSPQNVFVSSVDRLESALDSLWNISSNNEIPTDDQKFDENKDPEEVLARKSLDRELHAIHHSPKSRAS